MKASTAFVATVLSLVAHAALAQKPPPPPMPTPPPPVIYEPRGPETIYFDYGSARIPPSGNNPMTDRALSQFVQSTAPNGFLARASTPTSEFFLVVTGHMDSAESEAFSTRLSQDRADTVTQYLLDHGYPRARITVCRDGSITPVGRAALNRRAEVLLVRDNKGCRTGHS
jgi:outer membrane protein OmpA-like peptidoglycan-associated protein